ncbi:protein of unknown function [Taphrina deformans PYCC 5710]|uniref:Ubiquitin carboxyl-terminal hydrolase n=1 Tax=Taphrina deformans (strain PYCC 5710 / ATCC 11124 / CBS 356.35 / IMI 108563 / JCM 9778 / NBRC 8474) TaxID=1097556 RepID=R4XDS6_TAPDE|nr:protein of unknown function [Taphrina deformans PYCC 5710]|eukprot:CCG83782.1 protein of unknown function [Taphrina deformans PYCC 5710]
MFGFGKSSARKAKDRDSPAHVGLATSDLELFKDGRDRYFGLENFGSTCYANSVLQALYYTPVFRNSLINAPYQEKSSETKSSANEVTDVVRSIFEEPYAQRSFTNTNTPAPVVTKKKKGLASWTAEEEEKEEFRKRAFYPKGELPLPHPMFPDPPASKTDPAFRGLEMKSTDDTATDLFKKKLLEEHLVVVPGSRTDSDAVLFHSLRDLYTSLIQQKQRTGILSPRSFMDTLRRENEMFRQNMHHDAHEFLNYMLNSVHDGYAHLTHKDSLRDTTFVHSIFEGTLASEVRCLTCENVTSRDESFLDLSLDIEENTSVSACMRAFSASEFLREKNKFFCEQCNGLQEAERRMKIRRLPRVLALHLKRFKFEQEIQRHVKLQHVVRYETTLRLGNTTDDASDPDRLYELYAVVVHLGGASYHGHYIACVRTDHLGWILFDDEHVERIPESVVMRFVGGEDSGTACAYVLFYRTVDVEESIESKASLSLPTESIHAAQMPPPVSTQNSPQIIVQSPTLQSKMSDQLATDAKVLPIPTGSRQREAPVDKSATISNLNNSISPPQAVYMKRAGLPRSLTSSSVSSSSKPVARRMLSNVFSSSNNSSPTGHEITDKSILGSSPTPVSAATQIVSPPNNRPRNLNMSNLPTFSEKHEHHGPYTGTVVTSTPMDEEEEPDWNVVVPDAVPPRTKPQRPLLGEKKTTGLSRFSSFRGKRGSFFGGKKDDEQSPESTVPKEEKLKRRTSVFGMSK